LGTWKLWCTFHLPSLVRKACEKTLSDLRLDYLDLYLTHFPMGVKAGDELFPLDEHEQVNSDGSSFLDTWRPWSSLLMLAWPRLSACPTLTSTKSKPFSKSRPSIRALSGDPSLLDEPKALQMMMIRFHNAALSHFLRQVLIRFHIQRNVTVVAKSVTPHRIWENFQVFKTCSRDTVFDFALKEDDKNLLLSLNKNFRFPILR
ncbi:aldo-keto reductase family 1 member B1-like, partial [Phyllopteryx taeniolatus]|uniref:aldo-keto reductase family 1 member B1-like n=1 Tax=Phyllopteryx taeniolatus TaxID=161469 RepID=UPI002AD3F8FF